MSNNIHLEYNEALKKQVESALERVEKLKYQELFKIAKMSSQQYQIKGKGISFLILDLLK